MQTVTVYSATVFNNNVKHSYVTLKMNNLHDNDEP